MKLLRLILQGFKSFADRTEISFAEGITIIVGPNGCGKSNISDAVRWVLGEQNIRNLRGQKAEDIIFAGSASRKAKNGAEVTMVLDNSARELPLDTAEVSVTRRVLRNGDSDFFINQRACRLKDIQDLFAAVGLGRGSLAIIGQNRVDQVLSARPEERRLIFEEVAGISRYRMRKDEGLGKLRRTEENMDRVKDLMAVLEEQLGPMAAAAEKAHAFGALLKERQAAEATASLLKLSSVRRMLARYETEHRTMAGEKQEWDTKLSVLDAERASMEAAAADREEAYRAAASEAMTKQREMDRIDGDYRVQESSRRHGTEEMDRLRRLAASHGEAAAEAEAALAAASEEKEACRASLTEARKALTDAEAAWAAAQHRLDEASASHRQKLEEIREKTGKRERLSEALRHAAEETERLARSLHTAETAISEAADARKKAESSLTALDAEERSRSAQMAELEEKGRRDGAALKDGQKRSFSLLNAWNEARSRQVQLASQREYLMKAEKEYASFSNASRTVLQADMPWQSGIRGALGELLQVPAAYTEAAEAVLGGTVSYIVTDTAETAGEIIQWMKRRNAGRTTFYPLDAMHPRFSDALEREAAQEPGVLGIVADLFGCAPGIEDLKRVLLGRVLIAEDLDTARRIARKYRYRLSLVTLDGQILRPGGSMTGGSMRKRANTFFGRKQEIAGLSEKAAQEEKEAARLAAERKAQEETNASLSDSLSRSRESWQALHVEAAAAQGRREGLARELAAASAAEKKAQAETEQARTAQAEMAKRTAALQAELAALGDIPDAPEETEMQQLREEADRAGTAVSDCRVRLARAEETLQRACDREKERRETLDVETEGRRQAEEALAGRQAEDEKAAAAMEALSRQYETARAEQKAAADRRDALQNEMDQVAIRRSESDRLRREAQEAAGGLDRKLAERELRIEEQQRLEKEELARLQLAGLTEASAEALRMPGNMPEIQRRLAGLKEKIDALGPVNPNAEAEYALEKERLQSYQTQVEDLEKAREGLEKVIHGIDKAMASHFMEAFSRINEEFNRIMQLMFRGGRGRLVLTAPDDPLSSGVELYLELPGKKRQPLTLMSGGERALTVIALLISFLAYRPAPFCFVDEIDAALDDANVERFSRMMEEYKKKAQFIVITHRKKTMEYADTLQGVTMGEKGVSALVTVRMEDYIKED